jgi:hypothetical protein
MAVEGGGIKCGGEYPFLDREKENPRDEMKKTLVIRVILCRFGV